MCSYVLLRMFPSNESYVVDLSHDIIVYSNKLSDIEPGSTRYRLFGGGNLELQILYLNFHMHCSYNN